MMKYIMMTVTDLETPAMQWTITRPSISSTLSRKLVALPIAAVTSSLGESGKSKHLLHKTITATLSVHAPEKVSPYL